MMETNTLIQYTIVGAIVALAILWVLWKAIYKGKKNSSACCGCALTDSCSKQHNNRHSKRTTDCKQ